MVTILLLAAIAGGVWFFVRTKKAPAPAPPAADDTGSAAPAPSVARSTGPAVPPTSSAPAPPATGAPSVPAVASIPESRGSSIVTPDWTGRSPVWMIHFSSYQRKENADRDAARLAKLLGRPLRVVEVNLGAPGIWYRVMLGEYGSRDEAQAERDALAAKGTPGVGLVYRVEGLPPSRVEGLPPSRVEGVPASQADAP
jgi:cell division protein FtsN